MKKLITRRNFLLGLSKVGATGVVIDMFLDQIIYGHIKKLFAQETTNFNYIGLYLPKGPPTWMSFLPLHQDVEKADLGYNPMVATGWSSNTTLDDGTGSLTPEYVLEDVNGVYLPPLWKCSPTSISKTMEELANNCIFVRGLVNTPIHSDRYKQFTPRLGTPSLHALPSIISTQAPLTCVDWNVRGVPFEHPDSKVSISAVGSLASSSKTETADAQEIMKSILNPFMHDKVSNISSELDTKIEAALYRMEKLGENYNINSKLLHSERSAAKELFSESLEVLIDDFADLYDSYGSIISDSLSTEIPNLDDKEIYKTNNPDSLYSGYSGSDPDPDDWFQGVTGFDSGEDLRSYFENSYNNGLQVSLAMAEILLKNNLTNSLLISAGDLQNISTSTSSNNELNNDAHSVGAVPTTLLFSKYYQGLISCLAQSQGQRSSPKTRD